MSFAAIASLLSGQRPFYLYLFRKGGLEFRFTSLPSNVTAPDKSKSRFFFSHLPRGQTARLSRANSNICQLPVVNPCTAPKITEGKNQRPCMDKRMGHRDVLDGPNF